MHLWRLLIRLTGISILLMFIGNTYAQSSMRSDRWTPLTDSLLADQISLEDDDLRRMESQFFAAVEAGDCDRKIEITHKIARAVGKNKSSILFPSFLADVRDCSDFESAQLQFFLGTAAFAQHNFSLSVECFERARINLKFSENDQLTYLATFNLAGALNNLGETEKAIDLLSELIESGNPFVAENRHNVLMNLGAMQMSNFQYDLAFRTFEKIDRSQLKDRFENILRFNELILFQNTGSQTRADSMWVEFIRDIEIESLPAGLYTAITRACLSVEDFVYFKRWKRYVRDLFDSDEEFLVHVEEGYHPLFEKRLDSNDENSTWQNFVRWEKYHQNYLAKNRQNENFPKYQSMIETLEEIVIQEREAKEASQRINWIASIALLLAFSVYQLALARIRRKRIQFMEKALVRPIDAKEPAPIVNDSDLRVLSEAISKGTRISDASLVIRKLRMMMNAQANMDQPEEVKISSTGVFNVLNESEKAVADFLANGFDAKEIARLMKVSTGYVYNVRSRIRMKLEIPEEQNLTSWLKAFADQKGNSK